ncbi:hypothetical protein RQP46_000467 [Phenoliferia psychrophenolica]
MGIGDKVAKLLSRKSSTAKKDQKSNQASATGAKAAQYSTTTDSGANAAALAGGGAYLDPLGPGGAPSDLLPTTTAAANPATRAGPKRRPTAGPAYLRPTRHPHRITLRLLQHRPTAR